MKVSMELWSKNWQEFLPAKTVYDFKHLTIGKVKLQLLKVSLPLL